MNVGLCYIIVIDYVIMNFWNGCNFFGVFIVFKVGMYDLLIYMYLF